MMTLSIPPVEGQHGSTCACRHCASQGYVKQILRADRLQHEVSRLEDLVRQLRAEIKAERHIRFTTEMYLAVERGDEAAWERAMREGGGTTMIVVRVDRPGCGVVIAIVDNFDEFMSIRCAKSGMNKIGAPDQSIKLWGIDGPALVGQRVELNEQALIDRCSRGTK